MNTETTLNQEQLGSIKRSLFEMIRFSGKQEVPAYQDLAEHLDTLNFIHFSVDRYAVRLSDIIREMIDLDDLAFDLGQLYQYQQRLN